MSTAGELTRAAIAAQPEWLGEIGERVGGRRLPAGARVLFTGCGTSYHAARACGTAAQALDVVIGAAPEADVLVAVSHEGETTLTLEALRGFTGETWLVTGAADSPIGRVADNVVVATPELEKSYCHTASYTCAVAAGRALLGEDVAGLPAAVERELAAEPLGTSGGDRFVSAGAGADYATVLEGALKLREEPTWRPRHTRPSSYCTATSRQSTIRFAAFLLRGPGRAAGRTDDAAAALTALGCDWTIFEPVHPVVDVVRFQRLAVDLAELHGIDPDMIRWDSEPWDRARKAHGF